MPEVPPLEPVVGLSTEEARRRLARDGPNELAADQSRSLPRIFLAQLASPLILVLIAAAIVSRFLGESVDAMVIVLIVFINAAFGCLQEYRAERAVQALRRIVARTARVRRDGATVALDARELVVGDVVELEVGDIVPADVQLQAATEFTTNEAVLTGESTPVSKDPGGVVAMGVEVTGGYGGGVVVATGVRTALGRTSTLLAQKPDETEFQHNMARLSTFLIRIIAVLTAFVFVVNTVAGRSWFEALLFALALAVGITPEVLPAIVTISLSRGAMRMARSRVVVKRLMSVENLGNMHVLCCDKTGTLTLGTFSLVDAVDPDGRSAEEVLTLALVAASAGDAVVTRPAPDATDRAIWGTPLLPGLEPRLARYRVVGRRPIEFTRRRTVIVADGPPGRMLLVKGGVEALLDDCSSEWQQDASRPLTAERRLELRARADGYEQGGLRVIALADKPVAGGDASTEATGLVFRGMLTLRDPPKEGVREALDRLELLGVDVKVFSGDSVVVTRRICNDVDLPLLSGKTIDGAELEGLSDAEFQERARSNAVFARVTPEQKYRLVAALRRSGEVVGFLGDGVNDAPALRAADVGIAVDTGADVAKDAADVVLLQKSLMVIADGIEEGRRTFANITKYLLNTLSANFGNMTTVAASSAFLPFIPLLPSQILLNNLLSDVPMVTIAADRVDPTMLQRPRRWNLAGIGKFMVVFGLLSAAFDLLLIAILRRMDVAIPLFRTAWFIESALSEIIVTFAIRTRVAFFRSRPATALVLTSIGAAVVTFLLPLLPIGRRLFAFVPLGGVLLPVVAVLVGYFVAAELVKRRFFARVAM